MDILLGRLHPLIVHFPIALLLLIVGIELIGSYRQFKSYKVVLPLLWGGVVLSTWVTIGAGYLLFTSENYTGELAHNHRIGGFVLGFIATACGGLYFFQQHKPSYNPKVMRYIYVGLLSSSAVILTYTSHMGGTLTHGEDFLELPTLSSAYATASLNPLEEGNTIYVYEDLIRPVMKSKCMSCHNAHKAKGELRLHTWADMIKGGQSSKPMLVAGSPDKSELFYRMTLPMENDEHMPPTGKPQPDSAFIQIVKWWIDSGALQQQPLIDSLIPLHIKPAVQNMLPQAIQLASEADRARQRIVKLQKKLDELAKALHVDIDVDPATDSQFFALSLRFPPAYFSDDELSELMPYADAFSKVSLPGAQITDEGLYHLGQMPNLRELYLPKTCIKGDGLVYLTELPNLTVLNLSHTSVDEVGALHLMRISSLEEVFIYQTDIGMNLVEAWQEYLNSVEVSLEQGPYF